MFQLIKLVVIGGGLLYVFGFVFTLFILPDTIDSINNPDGKKDTPVVQASDRVKPLVPPTCSDGLFDEGEEKCFSVKGVELGMNAEDFEKRMLKDDYLINGSFYEQLSWEGGKKTCNVSKTTDEWTVVADNFYHCNYFPYYGDKVALQAYFANDSLVTIALGPFKEETDTTNGLGTIPPIIKALSKKYSGTIQTELKPIEDLFEKKFNAVFIDDFGNKMEVNSEIDLNGSQGVNNKFFKDMGHTYFANTFKSNIVISSVGLESFIESRIDQYNNELMRSKIKHRKSKESDL